MFGLVNRVLGVSGLVGSFEVIRSLFSTLPGVS